MPKVMSLVDGLAMEFARHSGLEKIGSLARSDQRSTAEMTRANKIRISLKKPSGKQVESSEKDKKPSASTALRQG